MGLLNPISDAEESERKALSPRVDTVEGKRIGLLSNGKPAAGPILSVVEERLSERHPDAEFEQYSVPEFNMLKDTETLEEIQAWASETDLDVAISAMGDCGSCTKFLAWGTEYVEKAGVPAVGLIDEGFEMDWKSNAIEKGRPLRYNKIPVRCEVTDIERIRSDLTDDAMDEIVDELIRPLEAGETVGDS